MTAFVTGRAALMPSIVALFFNPGEREFRK